MATTLIYDKLDSGIQYHYNRVHSIAEGLIIRSNGRYLFNNSFAVITEYNLSTSDNVHISSTLGDALYAYVLGFQPYTLIIQGILYNNPNNPYPVNQFLVDFTGARAFNNSQLVQVAIGNVCFGAIMSTFTITGNIEGDQHSLRFALTLQGIA